MRKGYVAILAALAGAGTLGQPGGLAAQEVGAGAPVQVIGPLFAYGPDVVPPPRYTPGYGSSYQPNYRPRRYAPRYGERNARQYAGNGYGPRPWYGNRYGYSPSYRRAPPWIPRQAYQDRYAARIITPRMNGRWRDLGPIYQTQTY